MAKIDKAWRLFTDVRPDASGLVSVHPHERGALLCRRTADGWLAYLHECRVEDACHVPVDALRLSADGPWAPWETRVGDRVVKPEAFAIRDYGHVAGGPEAAALALMAKLGDPFGVHAHEDQVQLASSRAVVTGPLAEWRPALPDEGVEVPASVLPALALGADEFEVVYDDEPPEEQGFCLVIRARGALRARARPSRQSSAQAAHAGVLARVATFAGEAYDSRAVAKQVKNGEPVLLGLDCAEVAGVVAAFGRGEFRATDLGVRSVKLSAEVAPGWVAAVVLQKTDDVPF